MAYDHDEEHVPDPLMSEADVAGLYPQNRAAAASRWTSTIGGSGNGTDD